MDLGLKGKRAFVMGSSSGLGRAVAESLLREGARVVLNGRDSQRLAVVAKEIGAEYFVAGDLTQPGVAAQLTREACAKLGGIDILVTNTGGPGKGLFSQISEQQWHQDFQSLWMSVVESLGVCLPLMKAQNFGRVVMVTSLAAKEPLANLTTSNGLRAGLSGLCKSISNEYAAFGITMNVILPGYTDTDRLKELKLSEERIRQMVPAGRLGRPQELGDLAAFLASDRAAYITGQSLAIDGGVTRSL